ncbi:tRNA (guanosine(37)-N1)-methyltransferase TrmD [Helicobacter didelphidarum]|uniref:tRNA (guanine-N(1)-)-methyltransferase n=1 Tax=Helicobacter didelphidarum TaxID=2040648 RepID=A0A3D8IRQ3_9HELI|nr:tRNA (guanosine(37)-N1)-methyltransferase TrmD [Helicobacter didelphidarum]RDU67616.1 tRNA (guanosine(37)-N1)-methyltransferase TrmD [Helicobacter didelphidarum]
MKFSFFTLFPQLIQPYFQQSIMGNAHKKGIIEVNCINIRDFATNKYKKVDDTLTGGGAGMLLNPFVLHCALQQALDTRIIFLSPCGAKFTQQDAKRLSQYQHISFVCGRYEGFDERIIELYATEIFSIGDFILSGGELAALCMADSIARNLASVLGSEESLQGESFESNLLEAPNFTKSKDFDKNFPNFLPTSEYLKGNHAIIVDLKFKMSKMKTQYFRPDLFQSLARIQ